MPGPIDLVTAQGGPAMHPSEDAFDDYVIGRMKEPALAPFEEHLLVCGQCLEELEGLDTLRTALQSE